MHPTPTSAIGTNAHRTESARAEKVGGATLLSVLGLIGRGAHEAGAREIRCDDGDYGRDRIALFVVTPDIHIHRPTEPTPRKGHILTSPHSERPAPTADPPVATGLTYTDNRYMFVKHDVLEMRGPSFFVLTALADGLVARLRGYPGR